MQRDTITAQQGQGLLVSFAVLILIGAIGTVAYTVIQSEKIKQETKNINAIQSAPKISDSELQGIAQTLVKKHLGGKQSAQDEDIQALSNTLHNLKNNTSEAAAQTLLLLKQDKLDEATDTLKALALDTKSKRDAAKLWVDIGNISNLSTRQAAIDAYQKSVTLDPDNINAWNRIGHLERANQNFDRAEIAYKNVTRLSGDMTHTQALSFANFGLLHQSQKKYQEAIESFTQALKINTQLNNTSGIASNNENLASLQRTLKNYDSAESHYKAAFEIYRQENQQAKLIELHSALGSLYQTRKQTELALLEYEKALSLTQENPNKRFSAGLYANMGILSQQSNDLEKAESYFNQALVLYQALQQDQGTADQYSNLAILARNKKQFENSESLHLKSIELYEKVNATQAIVTQYTNLGFLYTAWNKAETACTYWQKSLDGLSEPAQADRKIRIQDIINRDCQAYSGTSNSEDISNDTSVTED